MTHTIFHLSPLGSAKELNWSNAAEQPKNVTSHSSSHRPRDGDWFNFEELIMNEIMSKTEAIGRAPMREILIQVKCQDQSKIWEEGDMIIFTPPKNAYNKLIRGRYPQMGTLAYINTFNNNNTMKVDWVPEELLGTLGISNTIPTSWATSLKNIEVSESKPAYEVD